ncbi:MAG: hypothetical protein O2779_05550 [Nanoarchaeota archaeon]|nr:hypothetical protein [Nanoarchaeota archaeon]
MPRFERSREGKRDFRRGSSSRDEPSSGGYQGPKSKGSYSRNRESRYGEGRRELELTKVTCAECKKECEVPFKPTSKKPVFCRDCFSKKEGNSDRRESSYERPRNGSSYDKPRRESSYEKPSNDDNKSIHEKLDKIMQALDIE